MLDFDLLIFSAMGVLAAVVAIRVMRKKHRYSEDEGTDEDWRSSIPDMDWGDPENPEKPDDDESWRG